MQEIFERASGNSFTMNLPNDIVRQMNLILNEVAIKYATEGEYEKAILLLNRIIKIEVPTPELDSCGSLLLMCPFA